MKIDKWLMWRWIVLAAASCALAFLIPLLYYSFLPSDQSPVIIVLDPGHGGQDTGAINTEAGLYESELNLAIAEACRDELGRYSGVIVYMTRGDMPKSQPKLELSDRVDMAGKLRADMLVSLHCNEADSREARGAEIFVSRSTYKREYNQKSTLLAIEILKEFRLMGVNIRGVKTRPSDGPRVYHHDDGTDELGDWYAVVGDIIDRYGLPGILVEHAFIHGDLDLLDSPEKLAELGRADARAIARHFGLKLKKPSPEDAQEPPREAVIMTDAEVIASSDVINRLISLPENITIANDGALHAIWTRYQALTDLAREIVGQDQADMVYDKIIEFDRQKHPVRVMAGEGGGLTVDRVGGFVLNAAPGDTARVVPRGLSIYFDSDYVNQDDYAAFELQIVILDSEGERLSGIAPVSTGNIVRLTYGDSVLDELFIVIEGDINGDGLVTTEDQQLLDDHLSGSIPEEELLSPAALKAADVDGDGRVNEHDLLELARSLNS